ncbi:MAG: SIR2 family protein [Acutalibacteraceae bacterium]
MKLVDQWEDELKERNESYYNEWKASLKINDENKYSHYSDYYEERFRRNPEDGYNFLEKIMMDKKPSVGYVLLSYILCKTSNNVVITTNFDRLVEESVNYYEHIMPLVIPHEALAHLVTKDIQRPTILKVHRDLLIKPINKHGRDNKPSVDKLDEKWESALSLVFENYCPIFIGYAGNDNSLMDFLIEKAENFRTNKFCCPYWVLYNSDTPEGKVKEFLDSSDGYIINGDGFDELMYRIGSVFDYGKPTKDDFLADAEARYKTLSNAIDEMKKAINSQIDEMKNKVIINNVIFDTLTGETIISNQDNVIIDNFTTGETIISNQDIVTKPTAPAVQDDRLKSLKAANDRIETQSEYVEALELIKNKDYDAACKKLSILIRLEPNNAEYHYGYAYALACKRLYNDAVCEYSEAIRLKPDKALYYNNLACAYRDMGPKFYDEAMWEYIKAMRLDPEEPCYISNYAYILHLQGEYESACIHHKKAIDLCPNEFLFHYRYALTLFELGDYDKVISECEFALSLKKLIKFEYDYDRKICECKKLMEQAKTRLIEIKNK